MLEMKNLNVKVEDKVVLENLNLEVGKSETHVLLGPNGAGKTSLLQTIIGASRYRVVSGRIFFKGRDLTHLSTDGRVNRSIDLNSVSDN